MKRRVNGTGSIYKSKKKPNLYVGELTIGYNISFDNQGNLKKSNKRKIFSGSTKKIVSQKMDEYKKNNLLILSSNMNLGEYIGYYLKTYKLNTIKPTSYDTLDSVWKNHVRYSNIGMLTLNAVKTADIQKLINEKNIAGLSLSRMKKIKEVLNGAYKCAIMENLVTTNPVAGLKLPSKENLTTPIKEIRRYSDDDIKSLESIIYTRKKNNLPLYRHAFIFILILETGMREGEICALKWSNIKLDKEKPYLIVTNNVTFAKQRNSNAEISKRVLRESSTKTKSGRRKIPLTKKAVDAIKELKKEQKKLEIESDYLISTPKGECLNPRNLIQCFNSICKKANVTNQGIHALRHTMATRYLLKGLNIEILSKILGHASSEITRTHYINFLSDDIVDQFLMYQ
ncbi:MAG: tyrosine-type recombinase/integrase [Clostridium neonatale]|uniref:tyrosine-type recombinase/integrase n=1 Tax=Clostridium neonatale TaxID=137838 RepID=UPI00291BE059|nr:integrase [Clostridium neonatale]